MVSIGDGRLGHEHRDHDPERDDDRTDRLAQQGPLLAGTVDVVGRELLEQRDAGAASGAGSVTVADVVAGGLDRADQSLAVRRRSGR